MQNEFDYRKYLNLIAGHKRLFGFTALTVMTAAVFFSYIMPKKYEARSVVFVERNVLGDLVRGIAVTPSLEETLRGLNTTIKSRTILKKVANDLDFNMNQQTDAQMEALIGDLRNRTDVQLNDREGLITISFTYEDPRLARDYVNSLVGHYIEDNLSMKREESYGATSFLSEQIASIKEKLDKSEAEISRLRAERGAALAAEPGSIQGEINSAQQRLDELILRRSQLEASRKKLKSNNPARMRIASLQKRLEELRVEYTEDYPEVQKVKADIEAARESLGKASGVDGSMVSDPQELERVEAELNAVRISEANQRAFIARSRGLLHENPAARVELEKLEQEKNGYRALYDQLMARHGQAEVSKQMEVQDKTTTFRIVEPAIMPVSPVSPNRVRIILMGIAAGLACGLGLLLAIDYFDNSIKMASSLKNIGFPVIAVIPRMKCNKEIEAEKKKNLRLYFLGASWFSIILVFLLVEALHLSFMDRMIGNILSSSPSQYHTCQG